jgi:hypothetical protein
VRTVTGGTREAVVEHNRMTLAIDHTIVGDRFVLGEKNYLDWMVFDRGNLEPFIETVQNWYRESMDDDGEEDEPVDHCHMIVRKALARK